MFLALALLLVACDKDESDPCEIVSTEWEAELASVQSCEVDDDCGLPLPGTSCGCTRNLVGNNDADTEQLYYILQLGDDLGCELVDTSECDCPELEGVVCDDGTCTHDYVEPGE